MDQIDTYLNILIESLKNKERLYDEILLITEEQKKLLQEKELELTKFQKTINKKQRLIEKVNNIDEGFEKTYKRIEKDVKESSSQYKNQILILQKGIKEVTEKAIKIQVLEQKNKNSTEFKLNSYKNKTKMFKKSRSTAAAYYKNMANHHQEGQSYFMDKKK